MRSLVNTTLEIDDFETAAEVLLAGVGDEFKLEDNTLGVLICYSDMECEELALFIQEKVNFDVIGCTAIASMDHKSGFQEMSASFTVLTTDDCKFNIGISEPITIDNAQDQVKKTYNKIKEQMEDEAKLLIAIPPYILEVMLDEYPMALNEAAPGVPIIGGLPSYNANGDVNYVLMNGNVYEDRMVLVAVSGNIQPVFSVQNVTSKDSSRKRKVTKSDKNVIYQVGDQKFTDYLEEVGFSLDNLLDGNNTIRFVSNPLLLESAGKYSFARTLHEIDPEKGTGTAIGRIPNDALISVCSLERNQIEEAAVDGIRELKEKIKEQEASGYHYSTVIAISCIGRHLLMLPNGEVEVNRLLTEFPEGYTLSGFYSYGEIGPQGEEQSRNFAHNESLILCAI